jgi:monofunctional biosynthetic peptidoglycan transglycosylase
MPAAAGRSRASRASLEGLLLHPGSLVLAVVIVQCWFYAHVLWWRVYQPADTAFMEARLERLRAKDPRAKLAHQWVPYERISTQLKRRRGRRGRREVCRSRGIRLGVRFPRPLRRTKEKGKVVSGASTISQQLAKNLFLSGERSWLRKGQEAVITWMLESTLSKRRILELYLNFASGARGYSAPRPPRAITSASTRRR